MQLQKDDPFTLFHKLTVNASVLEPLQVILSLAAAWHATTTTEKCVESVLSYFSFLENDTAAYNRVEFDELHLLLLFRHIF